MESKLELVSPTIETSKLAEYAMVGAVVGVTVGELVGALVGVLVGLVGALVVGELVGDALQEDAAVVGQEFVAALQLVRFHAWSLQVDVSPICKIILNCILPHLTRTHMLGCRTHKHTS